MDISLLVDPVSVTAYVAKYDSKGDTVTVVLNKIKWCNTTWKRNGKFRYFTIHEY